MIICLRFRIVIFLLNVIPLVVGAQPADTLLRNFKNPPEAALPRTWWHWTGSNVSKEGITKDLEWMKRVGIGGFQAFDVSFGMGQNVEKKTVFFTPEWFDALRHTASEAQRLDLEMTMVTSAGWSETGGPWVKPEEAMKKIVWAETQVPGGQKFSGKLPAPPAVNGPIRNLTRPAGFGSTGPQASYYADQFVLAFRTPAAEKSIAQANPKVTSNEGEVSSAAIFDDDLTSHISLPMPKRDKPVWIQFEFAAPYRSNSFSLALGLTGTFGSKDMCTGSVEVSDDGKDFRRIISLPGPQHDIRAIPVRTYSYPETEAKIYRLVFDGGTGISTVGDFGNPGFFGPPPAALNVLEAKFNGGARVHRWEDKAHFAPMFDLESLPTPGAPANGAIDKEDVINVTPFMSADGTLNWNVPKGEWTIMRFGYSLTGSTNSPAVAAGTGLEVDKLSGKHLTSYYRQYSAKVKEALGPLYGKRMQFWLTDSFEADAQNWTEEMPAEFSKRRGYSIIPFLPVLAGRIVGNAEVSDRFLWDFRRTIADLLAENHYAALAELSHHDGIKLYGESAGISLPFMQDALLNKSYLDIPMGEFGMHQGLGSGTVAWMSPADLDNDHAYRGASDRLNAHQADIREAASASHIYGKKFVATESWTGGSYESPSSMKLIGDYWNTQGVNRFIFHTSTHQPLDTKPGNAMVGTHIHRNITWAEQAGPFVQYLARNSYLLQQGTFVGDIVYYLGEDIPSAVPYWKKISPAPPSGFDYDFVNADVLNKMKVEGGKLVLPSGMQYSVLVLPETGAVTPEVLHQIKTLVEQGATIVGPKPVTSPSMTDFPAADASVRALGAHLWGDADGAMIFKNESGKGKVYNGVDLSTVMADLKIKRDVDYTRPHHNTYISWIHRRAGDTDIYFLTNMRNQREEVTVNFRVEEKKPTLWHSDTGETEAVSYSVGAGVTVVPLVLEPEQSVFVIFRGSGQSAGEKIHKPVPATLAVISQAWNVAFQKDLGAPEKIAMTDLQSWTEHTDEGVKYFSGTATYTNAVNADKKWLKPGARFWLDLGDVKDIAEVLVNGKNIGTLWKPPYKIEITNAIKAGSNAIEIRVTNQWTNRIAGDAVYPDKKILSGAGLSFGPPSRDLKISGLLGPVKITSK